MGTIQKYQAALRHRTNPRYMTKDFVVPLYTGTEPDILDDSNTQRESGVYKEFPNEMPIVSPKDIQNQPYEQLELADGGRASFKKGGQVIENDYLFNFIKKNPGISNFEKAKKLNKLGLTNSRGDKITDGYLERFITQNQELKGLGAKVVSFTLDEAKQYARPKQLQDFESGLIDEATFRSRVNQYRGDLKRTPEEKILRSRESYARTMADPERRARRNETSTRYNEKRYLEKGMYPPSKNPKDAIWRDLLRAADVEDRVSLIGKRPNKYPRDVFESLKLKDNETGKIITYKNLTNHPEYEKAIKPYEIKFQINKADISPETKRKITFQKGPGGSISNIVIQHNQGLGKNPFNTSLAIQSENIQEYKIRTRFQKRFENAKTLSDKKEAINLFKKDLEEKAPNILSQPGKKAYGIETDVEGLLKTSKVPLGERRKVISNLTNYLNENPNEVKVFRTAGITCRRAAGGKVDIECLAENIIKETEKLETGTDLQKASAFNKFKNATKLGAGLAEEVIGFGKGVAGRTVTPLLALNSALEQFTSGNYREGFRKIGSLADLTTLVGDPLGFEKMRTEGTIEDVRGKIGKENQASFDRLLEFKNQYYQLQDINTKLQRAESSAKNPYDPETPGVDSSYIDELKKQQTDLNKIINNPKYQNIRQDYLNVGNSVKNEIFGRNINAPEQNKYTYETAAQEQLKSIFGENFYDELSDENKIIFKNLTSSEKIKENPVPFETPIQSPDDSGREGFAEGGGPKMGRRGFLGLIAGAAAAPDLIKALKGTGQAAKIASKIKLEKAEGMYPWFPDLIEKIKTKGKPFEEKEIIMEASYKHEAKGYGGLPKGVETVTRHVDGDTEFLLREYPDGRIAVDIHSPRNQEGSSTPVTLYYRPTMEQQYYSGAKVEPAEFKVLEKEPRYFANGPDDVDIEMSETRKIPGKNTIYGDVEAAERFATGKIENRKIIPVKQARREQMEDAPTDFIEETSPYGPETF
jgi:hypothetical protein